MSNGWSGSLWRVDKLKQQFEKADVKVNEFFDDLKKEKSDVKLVYRENQYRFAKDVMQAIKEKQVLLVQAGVGIGKSMGYLVPIFSTIKNVPVFKKVIISTSTIGLQQQLLADINNISKMLNVEINAVVAKGINNYVCLSKLQDLKYSLAVSDSNDKNIELLKSLETQMREQATADKDQLIDVGNELWEKIQLSYRGACSKCPVAKHCFYRDFSKDIDKANVIITNHNYLAKSIIDERDLSSEADMVVVDESHNLESAIKNVTCNSINFGKIILTINYYINNVFSGNKAFCLELEKLRWNVGKIFSMIRSKGSNFYNQNSDEGKNLKITDYEMIPIDFNDMEDELNEVVYLFNKVIHNIRKFNILNNIRDNRLKFLEDMCALFDDMSFKDVSENIYWAEFFKRDKISIGYCMRDTKRVTSTLLRHDIPIVFTSATMVDADGSYNFFRSGLSLNEINSKKRSVVEGKTYPSPYDYEKNALVYYDDSMPNPKNNYSEYLKKLPSKISQLMRITNGRALVLFTSKVDMDYAYKEVMKENFDFKIFKQGNVDNYHTLMNFKDDTNACLFATGAFWEGIDVKGGSLSNVIIARLPFPNVNAITKAKEKNYSKDMANRMVYVNEMAVKMSQGTGRLIRGNRDKGIICCLDSRFPQYIECIENTTPFIGWTNDINKVSAFAMKKITHRDGVVRGPYKRRKKEEPSE